MGNSLENESNENQLCNFGTPILSDSQFLFFQESILKHSGIRIQNNKKSLIMTRLSRRLKINKIKNWDEYINFIKSNPGEEIGEFINVLTTNKSEFFREINHFNYLKDQFLPELLTKYILNPAIWVAACSNGQEAYTIAMIIEEFNKNKNRKINPRILGTDIDTKVINTAISGIYEKSIVERDVDHFLIKKYFLKGSKNNKGLYKFNSSYSSNLKFRHHNLCDFSNQIPLKFDVIFLRNVLIYFSPETIVKVIDKMYNHLNWNGILILGHCESISDMKWNFETIQQSVYRKIK